MARTIRLRRWQRDALERFRTSDGADFLAVATPGAGKTTFALTAARHWLAEHPDAQLVVVAPTQHLKRQWAQAAAGLDLELEPFWKPGDSLPADMDGIVTTYQQVASSPHAVAALAARGFAVIDEIHHAGDDRAWGDGLRIAFADAEQRLCLSGTPFRSDTTPIPFVTYRWDPASGREGDTAVPDFEYGYGDALVEGGVVRPVHFPRIKGQMEWVAPDGSFHAHDFDDDLDRVRANQRLRTALSVDGEWLATVLGDAHRRLLEVRRAQPDAAGLVIAMDVDHARAIADVLERRHRVRATVATSDDPLASARIARFAKSTDPWIVAVRMVSEGVDIPRLRVGVFATNTTTELFFRQAVGRLVRWTRGLRTQRAWLYIPDDPRLRRLAEAVAEQRRHSLFKRARADDDPDVDDAAGAELDEPGDDEQLSLFQAMSAVATGVEGGETLGDDDEAELVWEPDDGDESLDIALPPLPRRRTTAVASSGAGAARVSLAEHKSKLRKENSDLVAHLVQVTGKSHREVNGELNRLAGVNKVTDATAEQLSRRIAVGEKWVKTL